MSYEHKMRLMLDCLRREERFLIDLKDHLEEQLVRLQVQEVNFIIAAENLKNKKKTETVNGIEMKEEPKIKTEPMSPKQMTTSNTEILESNQLRLGSIFKNESSNEEVQDLLVLDLHSDSQIDVDEIADVL